MASKQNIETCFLANNPQSERHQRATRCVSSDRIPIIGQLDENLWISTVHGSLGTSSAPFAASIISSQLLGWIPPVSINVEDIIDPERFKKRQARRGILKPLKPTNH